MVDQGLDVLQCVRLLRQHIAVIVSDPAAAGHPVHGLPYQSQRLADLLHAHQVACPAVSTLGHGHIKIELLVAAIGDLLPQIPFHTAGAQVRAGEPPFPGLCRRDGADALEARPKDRVAVNELFILPEPGRHPFQEPSHRGLPSLGQVLGHAADPEPARMHAPPGDHLHHVEDHLPVGKGIEDRRHGSHIGGKGPQPDQVAGDAEQLCQHDTDILGPLRYLDAA